jgi:pantoate--beta-alanine ligase
VIVLRTIAELRAALDAERAAGRHIGFVPTMGWFHEGHLSLMREVGRQVDVVVVSLFVNPTQLNETADLDAYPRDEDRDARMAESAGVKYLFAPSVSEIYPDGFATTVRVAGLTDVLEGASRGRAHFDGVATVVTKLLNIVQPDVAFFGQKDAQQALVLRRMVRDLDIRTQIEVAPTVREPDGLAMSSRNIRLGAADRPRALALRAGLDAALAAIAGGTRDARRIEVAGVSAMADRGVQPEYFSVVSARTLQPVPSLDDVPGDEVLIAVAARVGAVRLIDNELLRAP